MEPPLALPLGELSPKVTERALQALPIGSGIAKMASTSDLSFEERSDAAISQDPVDNRSLPAKT